LDDSTHIQVQNSGWEVKDPANISFDMFFFIESCGSWRTPYISRNYVQYKTI